MPQKPVPLDEAKITIAAIEKALRDGYRPPGVSGSGPAAVSVAADSLPNLSRGGLQNRLHSIRRTHNLQPDWSLWKRPDAGPASPAAQYTPPSDAPAGLEATVLAALRKSPASVADLAQRCACTQGQALDAVLALKHGGMNIHQMGERFSLEKVPAPADSRAIPEYTSRPDGSYLIGFTSDNHLCSKYSRLDVLNSLYDRFAEQGVDRVFNAGNWIDGEARFNKHDLLVHGMDAQCRYLAEHYPKRDGIVTHAVAGDDHEGWYCQREGVDIGRYAERVMREAGRSDWIDLGYMEAYVRLRHAQTGASCMAHIIHPGGGSAYATSYTTQKIAESYDGGDKPAISFVGHYHKLLYQIARNIHLIQAGTTEDQTPFMRKKKLAAHVGGGIARVTQDPKTGALTSCRVEFFNFFVRDYYNNRWSMSGDVALADRGV